jgi:hypothetical protein
VPSSTHGTMNRSRCKAVSHSLRTHRDSDAGFDHSRTTARAERMDWRSSVPSMTPRPSSESSSHTSSPDAWSAVSRRAAVPAFLDEWLMKASTPA